MIVSEPNHVLASGCGYSYYPQTEYVDRVVPVAYPVPFFVAIPTVSYLYNGGYGYSPVYQALPAAPGGQVTVAQPPTRPTNGNGNGAPYTSALLNLSDSDLDYLSNRIEQRLAARNGGGAQSPKPPAVPPSAPSQPATQPKAGGSYTDADVVRVLSKPLGSTQKSCADCHTGSSSKGGTRIFDSPGILNQKANWAKIWDAADSGTMPKEAQTNKNAVMSDADCDVLRDKMMKTNSGR